MAATFRVTALIAVFNEADIIDWCLEDLASQGIDFYVIDDGSTDGTADRVERFRGRGLLGMERSPEGSDFSLTRLMARKEALSRELPGDWFINHDADEFREGPWGNLALSKSIALVDRLGYNAIDFHVLDFWPTRDLEPGEDPRIAFTAYEDGALFNRIQIRCWKRTDSVELASTAGHEARFEGRRVFPIRFLMRHYPIRGQTHGVRKVFSERRSRFAPHERAAGWHVQYDAFTEETRFLRDPTTLVPYEPDLVRAQLLTEIREIEESRLAARLAQEELERAKQELSRAADWALALDAEADARRIELERASHWARGLQTEAVAKANELERVTAWARSLEAETKAQRAEQERTAAWARTLEAEVAGQRAELTRAAAWAEHLRAELESVRMEAAAAAERHAQETTGLRAEREQLQQAVAAVRDELSRARPELDRSSAELASLRDRIELLYSSPGGRLLSGIRDALRLIRGE